MLTPVFFPAAARRRSALVGGVAAVLLSTAACAPAPTGDEVAEAPGTGGTEQELSFTADGGEVFATFRAPEDVSGTVPGALIISGSGPTDRDGNSSVRPNANTNWNFSRVLADAGVASLRYDKLGSGETGTGTLGKDEPVDPGIFDAQVVAAYEELLDQPEVDPERVVVVGHSEGALYALRAHDLIGDEHASPALVLAAPPGTRYLDLIDRQLTEQVRRGEAAGQLTGTEGVQLLSDARAGRAALRQGHALPDDLDPLLGSIYSRQNADFLTAMDALDPVELGEDLPEDTPVLVLWGEEDTQVSREGMDRLMTGLDGAERVDIPGTDHIFRYYEDEPGATVLDEERPFAAEVAPALEEFLGTAW